MGPIAMFLPSVRPSAVAAALLGGAILCGCPRHVPPPGGDLPSAAELLTGLDAAEAKVARVRGEARLKAEAKEGRTVATVFIAVARPAFVHFEQLDFFGRPQLVLASDGQRFTLFDAQAGKWYRGPATERTMGRFLPLALAPTELATLLMGSAPRVTPAGPPTSSWDPGLACHRLELESAVASDSLCLDPRTLRARLSSRRGPNPFDFAFAEWVDHRGAPFAHRVDLSVPGGALKLELVWKDLEVNGSEDASLFTLDPPAGTAVIEVDAAGAESPAGPGAP